MSQDDRYVLLLTGINTVGIFSLLAILCLLSLASFCSRNQSIISQIGINQQCARASAAWRANNQIAQGNALGVICRVMIPPRRGKSIFLPTVTLLPCQGAFCYATLVPQGWWLIAPFRGAFVRMIIADGHCKWAAQCYFWDAYPGMIISIGHCKCPCLIHPDCKFG